MAISVNVILKQDVAKLGSVGDLVRVKPGFARNYLLPRSLAVVATEGNVKKIEHDRKHAIANALKQKNSAQGEAAKIAGVTVEITAQAGEGDKLFGSVTSRDIADALKQRGIEIDRKDIELATVIKALGEYDATVKFGSGVSATFKVVVVKAA